MMRKQDNSFADRYIIVNVPIVEMNGLTETNVRPVVLV